MSIFIRLIFTFLILFATHTYASTAVKFFSSNNTDAINLPSAYDRLVGEEQDNLKQKIIAIIQQNRLQQNDCEDVLGTYQSTLDTVITADNTKEFITSQYQPLKQEKIFDIAKQLAITLKQESVAAFIPDEKAPVADIILDVSHENISVPQMIQENRHKLPELYSQAFSLHLKRKYSDFEKLNVLSVEWLGTKIRSTDIEAAFPNQPLQLQRGKAYLVFANGKKQEI